MLSKIIFTSLCLGVFSAAHAQRLPIEKVDSATELSNLIRESESLAVLKEESVQEEVNETQRLYAVKMGVVDRSSVQMAGRSETYHYDLGSDSPVLGASFSLVPFRGVVDGGFDVSMSYLNQGGTGEVSGEAVQLHVLFLEPSLFVQKEILSGYFVPRLGAGWGVAALFQRGFKDESTSTSKGYGFAYGALDFNMSRLKWFKSELDWGVSLEHRRSFGQRSSLAVSEIQRTAIGFVLKL